MGPNANSVCMPWTMKFAYSTPIASRAQSPPGVDISSPEVLPPSIFSLEESKNKETTSNDLSAQPRRSLSAPRGIFGLPPLDHQAQGGVDGFFLVAPGSDPCNVNVARARRPLRPRPRGRIALAAFSVETPLSSTSFVELATAERLSSLPSFRCIDDMSDTDEIDSPTPNDWSAQPRRSFCASRDIFGLPPLDHQAQGDVDGFFLVAPGSDPCNVNVARARRLLRPRPRRRVVLAAFSVETPLSSTSCVELATAERLSSLPSFRCIDDMSDTDEIDSPIQLAMKPVDPHLDILSDVTCSTTRRTTTVRDEPC